MASDKKGLLARTANWWFGPEQRHGSEGSYGGTSPLVGVTPPVRPAGNQGVSADAALGLSAVYRSVFILSTSVSQMGLGVWRGGKELSAPSLINKPNVNDSRATFMEETTVSLALTGNAYWRLFRADAGSPVQNIEVLNPHNLAIGEDDKGNTIYHYGDEQLKAWQVKHLRLLRVPGSPYGLGPIQAAQAELRGNLEVRDYASNWFNSGGVPSGVLKTDQPLTSDQADAYRQRWYEVQAQGRGVAVLGNGVSYTPIYLSPEDAQFLQNQNFNITQVARMFGIPATYLHAEVGGNSMTYTNMEQVDIAYVRYTLTAYLNEIEEALTELLPRGQMCRFKVEALLRADIKTRYEAYKLALDTGFMTLEEVRASEGLPPLEVQTNGTPQL